MPARQAPAAAQAAAAPGLDPDSMTLKVTLTLPKVEPPALPTARLRARRRLPRLATCLALALAGGCAQPPGGIGLTDLLARPAERSLMMGLRAYDEGQYSESERYLDEALKAGPMTGRDQAAAHKHLAFIYCTTDRISPCEAAFRAARRADPAFVLSRSESGHPLWGPVYRKVLP